MWHLHAVGATFKTHLTFTPTWLTAPQSQREASLYCSSCWGVCFCTEKQVFANLADTSLINWLSCWFGTSWSENQTSHTADGGFWTTHWPCGVTMLPQCFWDGLKDGTQDGASNSAAGHASPSCQRHDRIGAHCNNHVFVLTGSWYPIWFALSLWCWIAYRLTHTSETKEEKLTRLAEREMKSSGLIWHHTYFIIYFCFLFS